MRRLVTQLDFSLEGGGFLSSSLQEVGISWSFSDGGEVGGLGGFFGGGLDKCFGEVIEGGVASAVVIFLLGASSARGAKDFLMGTGQFCSGEPELGRSQLEQNQLMLGF